MFQSLSVRVLTEGALDEESGRNNRDLGNSVFVGQIGIPIALRALAMNEEATVVSLKAARELRRVEEEDLAYQAEILCMDKLELLEEMVRFQEERSEVGHLTPKMMVRGKHLFGALEKVAETKALRMLTGSYRRHLECELKEYLVAKSGS